MKILYPLRKRVISSIEINHFRCFEHLELSDFGRINIIVGNNGAGKSSLLEAMALAGTNPQDIFALRQVRGLSQFWPGLHTKQGYETLWRDLFWKFDQKTPITINVKGDHHNARAMTISYGQAQFELFAQNKPEVGQSVGFNTSVIAPITFSTTLHDGKTKREYSFTPRIQQGGGLTIAQSGEPIQPVISLAMASGVPAANISANQLSTLDIKEKKTQFLSAVRTIFPKITDITTQSPNGIPEIFCTYPSEFSEKVPLGLISHGINKTISLLLQLESYQNGVVLVDEIETGLHHSLLPKAWSVIYEICEAFNVQLFASTHSKDCLDALQSLSASQADNLRLLRAEVANDGSHTVRAFKGKDFISALETQQEIR